MTYIRFSSPFSPIKLKVFFDFDFHSFEYDVPKRTA